MKDETSFPAHPLDVLARERAEHLDPGSSKIPPILEGMRVNARALRARADSVAGVVPSRREFESAAKPEQEKSFSQAHIAALAEEAARNQKAAVGVLAKKGTSGIAEADELTAKVEQNLIEFGKSLRDHRARYSDSIPKEGEPRKR
jgi:hypothetical protein